jgi:hypothetical protein
VFELQRFQVVAFYFCPEFIIVTFGSGLLLLEAEFCSVFKNVFVLLILIISNGCTIRESPNECTNQFKIEFLLSPCLSCSFFL